MLPKPCERAGYKKVGLHSTEVAYMLLTQQPRVRISAYPLIFTEKIINVAEVNQWRWLEETEQWFEYVDQTHLVLASGKQVLPKVSIQCQRSQER